MSIAEYVFVWIVDSTIGAAIVLAVGSAGMLLAAQPAVRQRIAEWTLSATLLLIALLGLPVIARHELGILTVGSSEVPTVASKYPNTRTRSGEQFTGVHETGPAAHSVKEPVHLANQRFESVGSEVTTTSSSRPTLPMTNSGADMSASTSRSEVPDWHTWIVGVYFCGITLNVGWLVVGYVGLVRIFRSAVPPSDDVQALWNRLSADKTSGARLLVTPVAVLPMTFGLRRPTVLISRSFCSQEFRQRLLMVLQHELVHVERRDARSWTLANIARGLVFHQPSYWWIRRQLCYSQEYVADSWAAHRAQSVADYAQVLTELAADVNRRPGFVCGANGIFHSHSELYRRVKMLSQAKSVADKWCGALLNFQMGVCAVAVVILLSLLTVRTGAQVEEQSVVESQAPSTTSASSSRTWHILRQPNTMGLFHGLPQRMEPFSTATARNGELWEGVNDGATLRLNLQVESETADDIFVGFFTDPRWWVAPPVQVRRFAGAGEYTVDGLPPGKYFVGAIMGSLPRPDALGVERTWPRGISIQPGKAAVAHVLVADGFEWPDSTRNPRDYVGDWPKLDPSRLVTVRTIDTDGKPIPYCHVGYSRTGGDAATFGTDYNGYAYRDDIQGTFSVWAKRFSFDPVTLAERYHSRQYSELHDAADRPIIQVVWEEFPSGTGTVAGKVHDQFGHPLREFHLQIGKGYSGPNSPEVIGMRIPVVDPDGRFEVHGLASGEYTITAMSFDYSTHVYQELDEFKRFTIGQSPNETVRVDVALESRQLRYGRAVYQDRVPVKHGLWSGPRGSYSIESDGTFRVALSRQEEKQLMSLDKGKIAVEAYGKDRAQSTSATVLWDDLSKDPTQPHTVVLPRPAPNSGGLVGRRATETPDDPDAIRRLKQLGASVELRDDGSVREIAFLDARLSDSDVVLLQKLPNIEALRFFRTEISDGTLSLIKELPNLLHLEIPNADITDWGIGQLAKLPTLRSLDLSETGITDASLRSLVALSWLERLELRSTDVTDSGMKYLGQLSNLKRLHLRGTTVSDAGLADISRLAKLEELDLSGLPITDEGLGKIAALTELTRLDLYGSKITDAGLKLLSGMHGLKALNIGGTLITDESADTIAKFSRLEHLYLSRTKVTDACLSRLTSLENLRELYIAPNITDAAMSQLSTFRHLEVLNAGGPNITDAGIERIAELTGLTNLYLDDSNITDASVAHLIQLRRLLRLSVDGTKITPDGMHQIGDSFVDLQVFGP